MRNNAFLKLALPGLVVVSLGAMTTEVRASFIQLTNSYFQDFNTLANHGKSSSLPNGWSILPIGNVGNFYIADDGSDLNGGLKSYGVVGSSNRALGVNVQANGNSGIFGAEFKNAGSGALTRLNISYTGEEWRLGVAGHGNTLELQYSLNATSLGSGTWLNAPQVSFSTPNVNGMGAHNGTLAANQVPVSGSISFLNIPAGATFWIRWTEVGTTMGTPGDGLAVDNFSLSAVPETSTALAGVGALGLVCIVLFKRRSLVGTAS